MRTKQLAMLAVVLMLVMFLANSLVAAEGEEAGDALVTKVVIITSQSEMNLPG